MRHSIQNDNSVVVSFSTQYLRYPTFHQVELLAVYLNKIHFLMIY